METFESGLKTNTGTRISFGLHKHSNRWKQISLRIIFPMKLDDLLFVPIDILAWIFTNLTLHGVNEVLFPSVFWHPIFKATSWFQRTFGFDRVRSLFHFPYSGIWGSNLGENCNFYQFWWPNVGNWTHELQDRVSFFTLRQCSNVGMWE